MALKYGSDIIKKTRKLRRDGYSFAEIAHKFKIAKSTASLWTTKEILNSIAIARLKNRSVLGQQNSIAYFRLKRAIESIKNKRLARDTIKSIETSKNFSKLICSILYWCEGSKQNLVRFTSSDPVLAQTFLKHLRNGFDIDEGKFRALMHLHQYHNELKQKNFWHQATNIPLNQFNRTFWKTNTGKNNRPNYPGCLAITYLNAKISKEIKEIYTEFSLRK